MTRFMGRGTRGNLPNSWDRAVDWRKNERKELRKKKEMWERKRYLKKEKEFYFKT